MKFVVLLQTKYAFIYTYNKTAMHGTNAILKFSADTDTIKLCLMKSCMGRKTPKSDFGAFLASWLHQDQEPEPVNRETFQFNGPQLDRPEFCDFGESYE